MTRIAILQMTSGIDPLANARVIADAIAEAAKRAKLGKDSYSVKYLETEPDPFEHPSFRAREDR